MDFSLHTILHDLNNSLRYPGEHVRLNPGALLKHDATLAHIQSLCGQLKNADELNIQLADAKTRFYLFVLAVNYLSGVTSSCSSDTQKIQYLARSLDISAETCQSVSEFFSSEKPYADKTTSVYIAPKMGDQLIRSKGVHVYFKGQTHGDIIYLKYVGEHELFLSKTFKANRYQHDIHERTTLKDLNVVTETNYPGFNVDMPPLGMLINAVKTFDPLQRVEISETGSKPRITLDPDKGIIAISGTSAPLSNTVYFDPILEWLYLFDLSGKQSLDVYLLFKYCNTYTSKFLVNFVRACNQLSNKGTLVSFHWSYEQDDDEMKEFGEYLQSQFGEQEKFHVREHRIKESQL